MKTSFLAAMVVAVLALAACAAPSTSTPSPSLGVVDPSASPGPSVTPSPTPLPATPAPTAEPSEPVATPKPKPPKPTLSEGEEYLLAGIRRDATDCRPVRDELPPKSGAGIECASDDPAVARIGFYYFERDEDMLAAYASRLIREGVALDSGPACGERASEGAYIPWDGPDMAPLRYGCFVNGEGYANFRITTGNAVYIGILGRTADMDALHEFAFRGNRDTPSYPTLWRIP